MNASNRTIFSVNTPKTLRYTALASVAALGVFAGAQALAADATAPSSAEVIVPIQVENTAPLSFGRFAPNGTIGAVTVTTNGTRSTTGPILSTTGTAPEAAQFDVSGASDATYSIAWSGSTALTGPADSVAMGLTLISDLDGGGTTGIADDVVTGGKLSTEGTQFIYLGGELAVAADQAAGAYTGNVTVTVEYN